MPRHIIQDDGLILAGIADMKINNIKHHGVKAGIVKKKHVQPGSFQSLLTNKLETLRTAQQANDINEPESDAPKVWNMIGDAARLLDTAMDQIQRNGFPDQEVVHSLHELHARLHQGAGMDGKAKEADVIIAVETNRLQEWE